MFLFFVLFVLTTCDFMREIKIRIDHSFGSDQNNYQVPVEIPTGKMISEGNLQSNCVDIAFFLRPYMDGELDFWMESCFTETSRNSTFWVYYDIVTSGDNFMYARYHDPSMTVPIANRQTFTGDFVLPLSSGSCPSDWTGFDRLNSGNYPRISLGYNPVAVNDGGSDVHKHSISATIQPTSVSSPPKLKVAGALDDVASDVHNHPITLFETNGVSNHPTDYVQMIFCYSNGILPLKLNMVGFFDVDSGSIPSSWLFENGYLDHYVKGGSFFDIQSGLNPLHGIDSITYGASSPNVQEKNEGILISPTDHGHTLSQSSLPSTSHSGIVLPFKCLVPAKTQTYTVPGDGFVALGTATPPMGYDVLTGYNDRFVKTSNVASCSGSGSLTHDHSISLSITATGTGNVPASGDPAGTNACPEAHTHQIDITGTSSEDHVPLHKDLIFLKRKSSNGVSTAIVPGSCLDLNCQTDKCPTPEICDGCLNNFYLHGGFCYDSASCPITTFADISTDPDQCSDCGSNCDRCVNFDDCTRCSSGWYLYDFDSDCYNDCPIPFYENDLTDPPKCTLCFEGCDVCEDDTGCEICADGWFLLNDDSQCYQECPVTFYEDESTSPDQCSSCGGNCDICQTAGSCQNCTMGWFLHEANCLEDCPNGYIANDTVIPPQCLPEPETQDDDDDDNDIIEPWKDTVGAIVSFFLLLCVVLTVCIVVGIPFLVMIVKGVRQQVKKMDAELLVVEAELETTKMEMEEVEENVEKKQSKHKRVISEIITGENVVIKFSSVIRENRLWTVCESTFMEEQCDARIFKDMNYDISGSEEIFEKMMTQDITHESILKIHAFKPIPNPYLLVEKTVPFVEYSAKKELSVDQKLGYVKNIAEALASLHNHNFVHGKLCMDAIFVTKDFNPRIKIDLPHPYLEKEPEHSRYASPEIVLGTYESLGKDEKKSVDVFSFSIIVFEILNGSPAYGKHEIRGIGVKVAEEGIRPQIGEGGAGARDSVEFVGDFPTWMRGLIPRMWDEDPEQRPSMMQIVSIFENVMAV